ncbi:group II intron reverse transcriptase/maturase [Pseudobutyrivibrio sp.]|uniref:group II intron reverse transcriptase/maturase n=1 Tax=Pseudobutyrivibrio sp. TaxID=2014367 RepID=UPI0025CCD15C|nr:group II intron reverse transcriptase/maturase [Pseudobutyrivibrio sp.]
MPKEQVICNEQLRHAEYYGMQKVFDELYEKSKNEETFGNLTDIIFSKGNILLAYRNIKANKGSVTPGTDNLTIKDIEKLTPEQVVVQIRTIAMGKGYHPRLVRRKSIPKPNGKMRPLGIPCIWDRLIQQCVKQVLEPICEAKFYAHSYGFRPNRSVEHAIGKCYNYMQLSKLHYVVEFDVEGFFDNVNHSKLIKQIWTMGIHDKHLLYLIRQMLSANILLEDGRIEKPQKGTPQGGIISPLLANIYLNELDQWVSSQWQRNPVAYKYYVCKNKNGVDKLSAGYARMKKTKLKEMYIVRYADDFRIFCRNRVDAQKILYAVSEWLDKRLSLSVSKEKTKIVNMENQYMDFLGFKMKVANKANKYVVTSHISDKALKTLKLKLKAQAKHIAHPRKGYTQQKELILYNSMVLGIQNYYSNATEIYADLRVLQWEISKILYNRLNRGRWSLIGKSGRKLTDVEFKRYGNYKIVRYFVPTQEPIYPIGAIKHAHALPFSQDICSYTENGRRKIHANLHPKLLLQMDMLRNMYFGGSVEFEDNKLSLYSAQKGKCAITGKPLTNNIYKMHCHHKLPKHLGGTDDYGNLVLILDYVHRLIHLKDVNLIQEYIRKYDISNEDLLKINLFRKISHNTTIEL